MWLIWFAILAGLFIMNHFLAPEVSKGAEVITTGLSVFVLAGIGGVVAGMLIRWLVIPRLASLESKLPAMVVGLALCELGAILSLFVVPAELLSQRQLLFIVSVMGIALSAPTYARSGSAKSPFHQS